MIYLIETTYYNKNTKEILDLLKIGYTEETVIKIKDLLYINFIILDINYYMKFQDMMRI